MNRTRYSLAATFAALLLLTLPSLSLCDGWSDSSSWANEVTTATIVSGSATDGQVITADGSGASAWESIPAQTPEGTAILSGGPVTDGWVLTADGAGAAAWEAASGAPEGTAVLSTAESAGLALLADGDGTSSWGSVAASGYATRPIPLSMTQADTTSDHALSGSPAPLAADTVQAGLISAVFDDSTDEARALPILYPPADATQIVVRSIGHATGTGGGNVGLGLYCRDLDGSDAWSSEALLSVITVGADDNPDDTYHTAVTLSTLSCTAGGAIQLEIARDTGTAGDLTGDWELNGLSIQWE